jgi:ATP-dependent Lon protease
MENKLPITVRPPTFLMSSEYSKPECLMSSESSNLTCLMSSDPSNPACLMSSESSNKSKPMKNTNYWKKIRNLITNVRKNKYILLVLIEFLSKFKKHITTQMEIGGMNKLEYFNLIELIDGIALQITSLRKILNKKNLLFFDTIWCQGNIECLADIYIHTLYLIEKYGGHTLVYTVNCYLLVYTGLQDIYFLWDTEYFNTIPAMLHTPKSGASAYNNATASGITIDAKKKRRLGGTSMSVEDSSSGDDTDSSSSQDEVLFPIGNKNTVNKPPSKLLQQSTIFKSTNVTATPSGPPHSPTNIFTDSGNKSVLDTINKIYTRYCSAPGRVSRTYTNTSNIQTAEILNKILPAQVHEYLDLFNNIIQPIQSSAFLISENAQTDLYNSLNIFHTRGILKNKSLFATNLMVSEIYRDLAYRATHVAQSVSITGMPASQHCWAADITNPLIYTTIPNFDKIRDKALHLFLRIQVGNASILFIVTGLVINDITLIAYKYNFTQRQFKYITQGVHNLDDISIGFRTNILKLLTIKQLVTATITQITTWCYDKWQLYNTIIKFTILEMMNYFLAQSLTRKTDILTVLLLNSAHADSAFRAYILWDLLIDENNGQIEKEIFSGLHTSIQSKLRTIVDINATKQNSLLDAGGQTNIKTDELTYEKRIQLLKTDDSVRAKAIEKLREINNKSNDNSSKPQQFLDGLLSIPFGTYAKEWIIINSETILIQSRVIIINFICLCYDYRDMYGWARNAIEWSATNFGISGLPAFINGLSSRGGSPSSQVDGGLCHPSSQVGYSARSPSSQVNGGLCHPSSQVGYSARSPSSQVDGGLCHPLSTNKRESARQKSLSANIYTPPKAQSPPKTPLKNQYSPKDINYFSRMEDESLTTRWPETTYSSALENYLDKALQLNKCGIFSIRQLMTYLAQQIIAKRVLVSSDNMQLPVLTEALESLDATQLHDIQYELLQEGFNVVLPTSTTLVSASGLSTRKQYPCINSTEILENPVARRIITECLIAEGYFYDIGYPTDLIRYQNHVADLLAAHDRHRTDKQKFIENTRSRLDASIYGQREAKDQIVRIIAQWVNGNQDGYCLGFEGSPGLGKTSLAKYGISQALVDANGKSRPFGFIALGGSANGSILEGHSYTYVGSTWGRIVDILMQSRCMNPIIFIDELDKISNTESGRELIGILTHLTDRTQNNEFMDKYFAGVKLDLSKVLFIFSYNDYSKLDPILADRIHRVQFENYTISDKVAISRDYLIPRIAAEINMSLPVGLDPATTEYIINSYTYEAGVRKLKEKYYDIFRELNVRDISGVLDIAELCDSTSNSYALTPKMIDSILATHHKIDIDRPLAIPRVGVVYGLYATGLGIGGLTIIQVSRKLADHGGILLCTGKQGDVMMESMKVALTLACGLVPDSVLEKWGLRPEPKSDARMSTTNSDTSNNELVKNNGSGPSTTPSSPKWSFHIHVPDGATSKDGPSAGCAITLGLVSLLLECPVRNDISMTGEIDMLGHVLPIGGLDAKITGSKLAGIREILVPRRNAKDLTRIQNRSPEICEGLTIHLIDTIQEVLAHGLVGGWVS